MKQLTRLHEHFIDVARRPMSFGRLPVEPSAVVVPVIPVSKWTTLDGSMSKTFSFRKVSQRNEFVKDLMERELSVGHHAIMTVSSDEVTLLLQTHDLGHVTELDKEYASYADELYRDVVYSPEHD